MIYTVYYIFKYFFNAYFYLREKINYVGNRRYEAIAEFSFSFIFCIKIFINKIKLFVSLLAIAREICHMHICRGFQTCIRIAVDMSECT